MGLNKYIDSVLLISDAPVAKAEKSPRSVNSFQISYQIYFSARTKTLHVLIYRFRSQ